MSETQVVVIENPCHDDVISLPTLEDVEMFMDTTHTFELAIESNIAICRDLKSYQVTFVQGLEDSISMKFISTSDNHIIINPQDQSHEGSFELQV